MDWRQYELNAYQDQVKGWNLSGRINFEGLAISVAVSDKD